MPALGWMKDRRDERDFLHPVRVPLIKPFVDMKADLPAVRDQGSVGSCVGHGVGGMITGNYRQKQGDPEWESPTWIYNLARMKLGWLAHDGGAYPRDALDQLLGYGLLKEHWWPYDAKFLDKNPPDETRQAQAHKWPDFAYFRCVDGLDGILSALSDGHIVAIGTPWPAAWMSLGKDGRLPALPETAPTAGGHETLLYGYDQNIQLLYGMNSWGAGWGDRGFYRLPFSMIETFKKPPLWGYDAHYVTFTPVPYSPPSPPPEPEKPGCSPLARPMKLFKRSTD